jgi:hypothetical protein
MLRVNNCRPVELQTAFPYFLQQMSANEGFAPVYETDSVIIYEKR